MKYQTLKAIPSNVQIQIYGQAMAEKMALLANVQAGDKVTALFPGGLGLKDGKVNPLLILKDGKVNPLLILKDGKVNPLLILKDGKVNPLLIFKDHIVINLGGRFGTPGVVDANNLVKVTRPVMNS